MATSQFYSVCLAHESIRACRTLLLASPCPSSRSFMLTQSMAAVAPKLRLPILSFRGSSGYGLYGPYGRSRFSCRAFSAIGSSPRSRKTADIQNPREEIRKLDEEIHRLERERRSVGKGKNAGPLGGGGKAVYGGRKGNAGDNAAKEPRHAKLAPSNRKAKFAAASGSSPNVNARAMARYAQEEEEDEEDDDEDIMEDDDDDIVDEDDEELGDDFSSDAEMFMETTDAEKEGETEASGPASSETPAMSEKPSSGTLETPILDPSEAASPISEAPIEDDVSVEGVPVEGVPVEGVPAEGVPAEGGAPGTKHPWKAWNDFFDVLEQKNYFKDVPPAKFSMEGEGYLRFQSSAHMKRAILEFSRERDDIIR